MLSDCCSVSATNQKTPFSAQAAVRKGKPVSLATLGAMAKFAVQAGKLSVEEYQLCRNRDCPVVYCGREVQLVKSDLRVLRQLQGAEL